MWCHRESGLQDVQQKKTKTKKRGMVDHEQARFLCLEYTFVLSIFLLLSVITVFMSSTVIFSPVLTVFFQYTSTK